MRHLRRQLARSAEVCRLYVRRCRLVTRRWLRSVPANRERRRQWLMAGALATLVALPLFGFTLWSLARVPSATAAEAQRTSTSTLWSRPVVLRPADRVATQELQQLLLALGYREWTASYGPVTPAQDPTAGQPGDPEPLPVGFFAVHVRDRRARFRLRRGPGPGEDLQISIRRGQVEELESGRQILGEVDLGPVPLLTYLTEDRVDRRPVSLEDVGDHLVSALLAAEDSRFYRHGGIAPRGIARAALRNLRAGKVVEGASTITQQVARNLFLTLDRSWLRKFREATLSMSIEARWTKDEILEAYANTVYLGARAGRQLVGVEAASRAYFGASASRLEVDEAALLAGMIAAPARFDPLRHPHKALERRNWVLRRMVDTGTLSQAAAEQARARPLRLIGERQGPWVDHFAALASAELERSTFSKAGSGAVPADERSIAGAGYDLYSTIDWFEQCRAQQAATIDGQQELALVAVDARLGEVRAYLGGHPERRSAFDRARRARRQMGSLAKPFVFAAAFEERSVLPVSPVLDLPLRVRFGDREWMPGNAGGKYLGTTTVADALRLSLNAASVRIALSAGIDRIAATLEAAGIADPVQGPSVALGAVDASPLEVANAYRIFAAGGLTGELHTLLSAKRRGRELQLHRSNPRRVIDEESAFLTLDSLVAAVERGTAWRVARDLPGRRIAGKTGTSNDGRDAWFAGIEGGRVTVVWTGRDDFGAAQLTGGVQAAEIFVDFALAQTATSTLPSPTPPRTLRSIRVGCGGLRRGYVPLDLLRHDRREELERLACDVPTFSDVRSELHFAGGVRTESRRRASGGWSDLFRYGWSRRRSMQRAGEALFERGWQAEAGREAPPLVEEIELEGPLGTAVGRHWIWDREAAGGIDARPSRRRSRGRAAAI